MSRVTVSVAFALVAFTLFQGCTGLLVGSQAGITAQAAPATNANFDYDVVGDALPFSIVQLEGMHYLVPDNENVLVLLPRAYTSYAYGWIEDEIERTNQLDFARIEYLNARARNMYLRARNLAFARIRLDHDGFDEARQGGIEAFQAWLEEECDDEDDAEMLFWAGYPWGSAINVSRDDPMMIADLAFARALVERSRALDETYFNGAATTFLAVVNSSIPASLGGDAEKGRELFERALEMTGRRFFLLQYQYARTYAVQTQNRELFDQLLNEILTAEDQGNDVRLPNKIALRRARRLQAQADELFFPQ
jgi:hypothetical protein